MSYPAVTPTTALAASSPLARAVDTAVTSVFVRTLTSVLLVTIVAGFGAAVANVTGIA